MIATGPGPDGHLRCSWCLASESYIHYHDHEWGFAETDDRRLFEKLSLEAFQSGLSWYTILQKRDNFRAAFAQFDFYQVAQFGQAEVECLLQDAGIVRHRGKIEAVVHNAARAVEMVAQEGSMAQFLWRFAPAVAHDGTQLQAHTAESKAMARALQQRGWKFVGPTTCYAFMQSMGMVNDHAASCTMRPHAEASRCP
jgi:DNA-3-methyladenine glycosylase I